MIVGVALAVALGEAADVAVLSGSEHASDIQRAHALGASAYYVKPLSVEQLRTRFQNWHSRFDSQDPANRDEAHAWAAPNQSG